MHTAEFLRTIDNCKMMQPINKKSFSPTDPIIDWAERVMQKWHIFVRFARILGCMVLASLLLLILPLWIVDASLGKAFLISIPPMLFVSLTWMVPAWKFYDSRHMMLAVTVGATPLRIAVVVLFSWMLYEYATGINFVAFYIGMMMHWILFAIPEITMMHQLSGKLQRTVEEEPKGLAV